MSLPKYGARRLSQSGGDSRHEQRAAVRLWRVVRHDGALLGGYSREADARRALGVIVRDDMPRGYAHVAVPRGAQS